MAGYGIVEAVDARMADVKEHIDALGDSLLKEWIPALTAKAGELAGKAVDKGTQLVDNAKNLMKGPPQSTSPTVVAQKDVAEKAPPVKSVAIALDETPGMNAQVAAAVGPLGQNIPNSMKSFAEAQLTGQHENGTVDQTSKTQTMTAAQIHTRDEQLAVA